MSTRNAFEQSPKLSELKISYRRRQRRAGEKLPGSTVINTSERAAIYLRSIWNRDTIELIEDFYMVCLNTANEPIGWLRISTGGLDSAAVDPRLIFGVALKTASTGIIVAHNHPSGNLTPSEEDRRITKRLKSAADLLEIRFVDHIIVTKDSCFSFADQRLLS